MSNSRVTVYSKPDCVQCDMTIKQLDKLGIPYTVESLTDNPQKLEEFRALGFLSAPVVVPSDGSEIWAGFIPAKIKGLVADR